VCIQNIKLNLEATAHEIATAQSQLLKLYTEELSSLEPQLQEYFPNEITYLHYLDESKLVTTSHYSKFLLLLHRL